MKNKERISLVVEFEKGNLPSLYANQEIIGGKLVGFSWNDFIQENKGSTSFKWKDFSKEKPDDDSYLMRKCIVRFKSTNSDGDEEISIGLDWYDFDWLTHNNVTHWIYADDLLACDEA